jgi:SAM-dependent methyltransferase
MTQSTDLQITREFWEKQLQEHVLLYPSEDVVRFLSREKLREGRVKEGLDVGFGSGRHLKALMDHGVRAHGVELFQDAIDQTGKAFAGHPLLGRLLLGDFRDGLFPPGFLDVVIIWGCLFLRPLSEMRPDLARLREMMRPGGRVCLNLRTKENWFCGLGEEKEKDFFLLDERAGPYNKALYAFVDEDEARALILDAGFEIENFERLEYHKNNLKERHCWWIVWARNPQGGEKS